MSKPKYYVSRQIVRQALYVSALVWITYATYWLCSNDNNQNVLDPSEYSIYDMNSEQYILQQKLHPPEPSSPSPKPIKKPSGDFKYHSTVLTLQTKMITNDDRGIDKHSLIYNDIFQDHGVDSVFGNLDFNQRCDLYFRNLFSHDHNWVFDPNRQLNDFESEEFKEFAKENEEAFKKAYEEIDSVRVSLRQFISEQWLQKTAVVREQTMSDYLATTRIFNKCYVTNDNKDQIKKNEDFISQQRQILEQSGKQVTPFTNTKFESMLDPSTYGASKFEYRVYPWLSRSFPIYERWTGEVFSNPPNMKQLLKSSNQESKKSINKKASKTQSKFLNQLKNSSNGKGIVISIADKHVDDTVNLIRLLRALKNALPIEIVYNGDLSKESKKKIIIAAREDFKTLPRSFNNVANMFGPGYFDPNQHGLPRQEVWFINTNNVLNNSYKEKFQGFANKLLATLFNSFEEFILMDADTIIMTNPEHFFALSGYVKSGALFFKDRAIFSRRSRGDATMFKKLSPSIVDKLMFDIPIMTDHSLKREFFKGLHHYMESGLVLLNRNKHFSSILLMQQLNFITTITNKVYGDKELFWLAFALNGDEDYQFTDHFAASAGELTPAAERVKSDGVNYQALEICSAHPAHLNPDDGTSLLWINSGFRNCHKANSIDYGSELVLGTKFKNIKTEEAFKAFYSSPLRITHAIVPPLSPDLGLLENIEGEPSGGWMLEGYCSAYMFCGYSSIGGKTTSGESNKLEGKLVTFDESARNLFNYLGDIWVGIE
ncbi:uncharacterized protein SPAPADRAFT_52212 [Spathaspora passalidarum NRRL Y-27907]|uniref:Alpha-1,3-mannosyltransferase n=1 Tax=Spathaspora passalidarum (strain NRRL Y-27907 / 11-Y1) TaxID=619300 RepID=G3AS70_SPAPN|nr:uncharacterized protein SPAPADRAFT_52212 [Spathaspora passalidarum NRRL Y-27907]EGW31029.1 hypothetical protein SPAPADRAFT_52212 [Spathaspora passalidarum NRRL Y-27907]